MTTITELAPTAAAATCGLTPVDTLHKSLRAAEAWLRTRTRAGTPGPANALPPAPLLPRPGTRSRRVYHLTRVTPKFVTALRVAVLRNLPVAAVAEVSLRRNTSVVLSELLKHRIQLLPIRIDGLTLSDLATDEGTTAVAALRGRLRARAGDTVTPVFSSAVEFTSPTPGVTAAVQHYRDDDEAAHLRSFLKVPSAAGGAEGGIELVQLGPGQEVDLEFTLQVASGRFHARFSPLTGFRVLYRPVLLWNTALLRLLPPEQVRASILRAPLLPPGFLVGDLPPRPADDTRADDVVPNCFYFADWRTCPNPSGIVHYLTTRVHELLGDLPAGQLTLAEKPCVALEYDHREAVLDLETCGHLDVAEVLAEGLKITEVAVAPPLS